MGVWRHNSVHYGVNISVFLTEILLLLIVNYYLRLHWGCDVLCCLSNMP